jgi:hypothetical protein
VANVLLLLFWQARNAVWAAMRDAHIVDSEMPTGVERLLKAALGQGLLLRVGAASPALAAVGIAAPDTAAALRVVRQLLTPPPPPQSNSPADDPLDALPVAGRALVVANCRGLVCCVHSVTCCVKLSL